MKKHISVFLVSGLLVASLSACSMNTLQETPVPTTESQPVVIEDTPSQDSTQDTPAGFVPTKDLKQQELEKDPMITKWFIVSGSCAYDEKSAFWEKVCIDFSNPSVKDDCITYGGQWKVSACDQKWYQKKCTDYTGGLNSNGKVMARIYQRVYTMAWSQILCVGISETLEK